jgi:hypothetical protein
VYGKRIGRYVPGLVPRLGLHLAHFWQNMPLVNAIRPEDVAALPGPRAAGRRRLRRQWTKFGPSISSAIGQPCKFPEMLLTQVGQTETEP